MGHTWGISAVTLSLLSSPSLPSFKISLSSPLSVAKPDNAIIVSDGDGDNNNGAYLNSITTYCYERTFLLTKNGDRPVKKINMNGLGCKEEVSTKNMKTHFEKMSR